jgi:hypothetical protein
MRRLRTPHRPKHPARVALAGCLLAALAVGLGIWPGQLRGLAGSGPARSEVLKGDGNSSASWSGTAGGAPAPSVAAAETTRSFSIAGHTSGLYPGRTVPLVLTLTNLDNVMISVTSVSTAVGQPSRTCAADHVAVTRFAGRVVLRPRQTSRVIVAVTMDRSTPNSCEGAVFPFRYSGLGTADRA